MSTQKTGSEKGKVNYFEEVEQYHPHKTTLFFSLTGSAVVFLYIILVYVISASPSIGASGFQFPKAFILSTMVMMVSSFGISHTMQAFKNDQSRKLIHSFAVTLFFAITFLALQVAGWYELYRAGYLPDSASGVSFLYLASGLHFLHTLGGIVNLISCMVPVYRAYGDMVKSLMYFSNRYQRTRIELLNVYWHYVDFLWLALFFTFLFTL